MTADHIAMVLILVAAFLHAVANTLIKISDDPLLTRGFMSAVSGMVMLPFVGFVPPPTEAAWMILLVSTVVHACYPFLVAAAYRRGDLSLVFPVARGISPLGVLALVAALDTGGASAAQLGGVLAITTGILLLCLHRSALEAASHGAALGFAAATGVVVALYTYLDAHGLRAAQTSVSYIVWLVVIDGAFTTVLITAVRRRKVAPFVAAHWRHGFAASLLGLLNFGMALYALGLGAMVEIAALRETSIVFAAFIGIRYLSEGFARRRLAAAALVAAGVATMQVFR